MRYVLIPVVLTLALGAWLWYWLLDDDSERYEPSVPRRLDDLRRARAEGK